MNRFRDELKIIPATAVVIAGLTYVGMALLLSIPLRHDPDLMAWPGWGKVLLVIAVGLPLFVYVLLVGYVNGDARRRGMRYVLWTFLAALIPNAIGIILYFVLRDPICPPCPACGEIVRGRYAFCPKCGAPLAKACLQCRAAVEPGWSHCAHCGAKLG
jgi:Double zinc ribbon